MSRLIESAERRAEMLCKDYDATNLFWYKVDALLVKKELIMKRMEDSNNLPVQNLSGKLYSNYIVTKINY